MGALERLLYRISGVEPSPSAPEPHLPSPQVSTAPPQLRLPTPAPLPLSPSPASAYTLGLEHPLLTFSKHDQWTIRDSFEGTQVFGESGSGKTSGSGAHLARSFLRAEYGGLVLTYKADECERWIQYCRDTGREDSLIIVGKDEPWRFNFLEYQYRRAGEGAGHTENTVSAFMNILESRYRGSKRQTQDDFWTDGARRLLYYCLSLLAATGEAISMQNLLGLIRSTPYTHPDRRELIYPLDSFCLHCLDRLGTSDAARDIRGFIEGEFARSGMDKQSAGVISTLTNMAHPLTVGVVCDLFCTQTNFLPDYSRSGAVIVLNFPLEEWEDVGRTAQLLFKYIWQRAMRRRKGIPHGERPVFLWVDEAQAFLTDYDREFQEAARSASAATVYLTQSVSNFRAALGENGEAKANALLGNLATKIFHRNSDFSTNHWAAEMIAKGVIVRYSGGYADSESESSGLSSGTQSGWSVGGDGQGHVHHGSSGGSQIGLNRGRSTSASQNIGWQQTIDYLIQPGVFTRLKGGGPESRYQVQGVLFKAGKSWRRTGHTFLDVTFPQQ
jgi:hypothetical protein